MSQHTLALLILICVVAQFAIALATPRDPRPWTPERKASVTFGLIQFAALIWLIVEVLA